MPHLRAVFTLFLVCVVSIPAQERQLEPDVRGKLVPGAPQIYTARASAGDLISGTFEMEGAGDHLPVTVALHDQNGSMVKAQVFWGAAMPVGFVTPRTGGYQIRIVGRGSGAGTYTLRTRMLTTAERLTGTAQPTPTVRYESPRITQLAKDVRDGALRAVERFWSEAEARRGPLVEPIAGGDKDVLVTFLWKETYETRNVLVVWPGPAPQDYYMSRIPGTNVWYETVRIAGGSRFPYALAPNNLGEEHPTAQRDPLNPRVGMNGEGSVLETPGAPDEKWYRRTPSVRGKVTHYSLESVLLKRRRDIDVYTPPGYAASNGPYPLLILFDGDVYSKLPASAPEDDFFAPGLGAPNTLDNLIANRRIPGTVACFVSDNSPRFTRQQDDLRQVYAAAMATELVPWLRASYAVTSNPKDVVIGGYSAGAGAAGYIALKYPDVFGNVLLQSGGGTGGILPALFGTAPKAALRFYLDPDSYFYAAWTAAAAGQPVGDDKPVDPMSLHGILRTKGYDVTYRESGGIHEPTHWAATLADGLMVLLGRR